MSDDREQRNAIFSGNAPPGIDPRTQTTTAVDRARADFGLDIPTEIVPLPSQGKVYPASSSLHNVEIVEIKAMTAREEDILTSKAYLKKGTVISELIKSCLVNKSIDPMDLLAGDRTALMVAIRITGYGAEYDAEITCQECEQKSSQQFDLSQLPIKRLEIDPVAVGLNVFAFKLPFCGKQVHFRFMTGRDEEVILATSEKQKKLGIVSDSTITTNLLYTIVAIDGKEDRAAIANFIKVMPARDSLALRNYMKDIEPGISMKQEVTCQSCGHSEEVSMPIGVGFLWPSAVR